MKLGNIIFFDIETIPDGSFEEHSEMLQNEFIRKHINQDEKEKPADKRYIFKEKAALYPPYNKIICVSCGMLIPNKAGIFYLNIRSIYGITESKLMQDCADYFNSLSDFALGGYNISGFDIPNMIYKFIKYGVPVPYVFSNEIEKKPWEKRNYDLMQKLKFGEFKSYMPSLCEVAEMFGIDNPKEGMSGANVAEKFEKDEYEDIIKYCEGDVKATIDAAIKYENLVNQESISYSEIIRRDVIGIKL